MEHPSLNQLGKTTGNRIGKRNRISGGQGSARERCAVCRFDLRPRGFVNRFALPRAASRNRRPKTGLTIALLAALAFLSLESARLYAEAGNAEFKRGQAAESRQDYDAAFDDYQRACVQNPKDLRFRMALDRVKVTDAGMHVTKGHKLLQLNDLQGALAEFLHAAEVDPSDEAAQQGIARVREAQSAKTPPAEIGVPESAGEQEELNSIAPPPQLKPLSNEPLTLHMTEDAKVIYQAIGKAAGINVLFDPDYNSKRIQVDLSNVSLLDALRIVGDMSNTFWRPVTTNSIFVAQNTRIKRTELDEQAVQTFYLTNAWQQNDLNDVQTALRNVLPNAKVYGVASQNAIVMRATPDELLLAQKLINDLDKPRPEVVVDVGVLEVSKNWEKTLGIEWPTSIGVSLQSPCVESSNCSSSSSSSTTTTGTTSSSTTSPTLYDLSHLKATDFAISVGSATLNLLLTDDNTQILQDPRIRATDGQKATLTIGSKIPIATGSYQTGAATALVSSLVNTQFQYIDVGVKLEITPTVHYDNDVTLKAHIEVMSESGTETISGVTEPILSQRIADQVVRLREGEASILGGIQDNQEQQNWTGIPGLSSIPILKYLFGSKDHIINDDDIVFVLVPHIVRGEQLDQANLRPIDTGEGQSIELRRTAAAGQANSAMAHPATLTRPGFGTVPGQSAPQAAMAALEQMRTSQQESMSNPPAVAQPAMPNVPQATAPSQPPNTGPTSTPPVTQPQAAAAAAPLAPAMFGFTTPAAPVNPGSTVQVPITIAGGADVASIPLQFHYDPSNLTLINVEGGDFLSRDGQAVAVIHRDDGPGNVTVVTSRPPGAAGVNGGGTVCVLTFQAKAAGQTTLTMTRAGVVNSKQQQMPAQGSTGSIQVK